MYPLKPLPIPLAVCHLNPEEPVPEWAYSAPFSSITRTPAELSIVCALSAVPSGIRMEGPWRALFIDACLDFNLTGVLQRLTAPLAASGIPVFAVSTYDTDYLLIPAARFETACRLLKEEWEIRI